MPKLTIKEIAKLANVSPSTVSFVLNHRPGVSEQTRQRVQAVIDQTHYTPNAHVRRLTLKKSFTIHVVMRQFSSYNLNNLFGIDVLMGIFRESRKLGYDIIFTSVDYSSPDYQETFSYVLDTVASNAADAVAFIMVYQPNLLEQLKQRNVPFVCIDSHVVKDGSIPLVELDAYDAAYHATNYLIQSGHTEIGFIGADAAPEFHKATFGGFLAALRDADLPRHPEWYQKDSKEETRTPDCMQRILSCKLRPTAVFCAGDIFAAEAIRQAKKSGFHVPQDISIISIDDLIVSEFFDPALTTMSLDKTEMGSLAMRTLYAMLHQEPYQAVNLLKTTLVVRDSVCPPNSHMQEPAL